MDERVSWKRRTRGRSEEETEATCIKEGVGENRGGETVPHHSRVFHLSRQAGNSDVAKKQLGICEGTSGSQNSVRTSGDQASVEYPL